MKEVRFFYAPDVLSNSYLSESESLHAVKVMRLQEGDKLVAADGKGHLYDCEIVVASQKKCLVTIFGEKPFTPLIKGKIILAIAPTKNMDRIEWMSEKATEVSLSHIIFLSCANSERKILKTERIEKIVVSAMKQSHNAYKPEVTGMTVFGEFLKKPFHGQKFIAHCYSPENVASYMAEKYGNMAFEKDKPFLGDVVDQSDGDVLTCVGPEGDFSIDEVCEALLNGFKQVSLGKNRLRTETAGFVATYLMYLAKRT